MKKLLLISLFLSCLSVNLWAQKYYELFYQSPAAHSELPFSLWTQAQNLEDFIYRFNGYHNAYGERISPNNPMFKTIRSNPKYWKNWRIKVIGSLLNRQLYKKDSSQNWKYIQALSSIEEISMDPLIMSAYLPFSLKISSISIIGEIELKFIELKGQRYEWIIHDVKIFNEHSIPPDEIDSEFHPVRNPNIFLPPNAHGNGFLLLQREVIENKSMSPYFIESKESFSKFQTLLHRSSSISFDPVYFQFAAKGVGDFKVNADFFIYEVDLK